MHIRKYLGNCFAGLCAGAVNGLLGAGGGMVLVPLLQKHSKLPPEQIFPASVSVILPICLVSLAFAAPWEGITVSNTLPYLAGSAVGGIAAGIWGKKIPVVWLHRLLGILILWGGIRYIW